MLMILVTIGSYCVVTTTEITNCDLSMCTADVLHYDTSASGSITERSVEQIKACAIDLPYAGKEMPPGKTVFGNDK